MTTEPLGDDIPQGYCAAYDYMRDAADRALHLLPDSVRTPTGAGGYFISDEAVGVLSEMVQYFAAELISSVIDAGSERDAVMENQDLRDAIQREVKGWARG